MWSGELVLVTISEWTIICLNIVEAQSSHNLGHKDRQVRITCQTVKKGAGLHNLLLMQQSSEDWSSVTSFWSHPNKIIRSRCMIVARRVSQNAGNHSGFDNSDLIWYSHSHTRTHQNPKMAGRTAKTEGPWQFLLIVLYTVKKKS